MPHEISDMPLVLPVAGLPPFAPTVIDSLAFAQDGRVIEGAAPLAHLPRLADGLLEQRGSLGVRLRGWQDEEGKSWLHLVVQGNVVVQCQRCLEGVDLPLDIDGVLQLIAPGEAWPDDELIDDKADAIAADQALDVLSLIEDEVLLALPIAPLHGECELPLAAGNGFGLSSFAALAALKKH
jgi:uncharacterized protein